MNILGTRSSVESLNRSTFFRFIETHLDTEAIVVATLGNVSFEKVKKMLLRGLYQIPPKKSNRKRTVFATYQPHNVIKQREGALAHAVVGGIAPSISDVDRLPYFLILNLMAGSGMNSRLNMNLREKRGLVYSVESNYTPYFDTGSLSIYFACDPPNLSKCLSLVYGELKKLCQAPLTSLQLHRAIKQLKGQLAMAEENNVNFMLMMGKSLLDTGKIESLEAIFKELDNLTPEQLHLVTMRYFEPSLLSSLQYKP
jgi:predicted Zn-dependent peptidase